MYQPNSQTLLKIKITRNISNPVSFAALPYVQHTVPQVSIVSNKQLSQQQASSTLTPARTVQDASTAEIPKIMSAPKDKQSKKRRNNKIKPQEQLACLEHRKEQPACLQHPTRTKEVDEQFKNVIGIDIGEFNTALTILQNNIVTDTFHYSMTNNKKDASFRKNLNHILYAMLDESIFAHFDNTSLLVKIEDQLPMNRKALVIQTTIETILYMKGYHVERVLPRQKYKFIKKALGITKCPAKTALVKYFEIDKAHVSYRVYNSAIRQFEDNKNEVSKCDDIIDSYLIATV